MSDAAAGKGGGGGGVLLRGGVGEADFGTASPVGPRLLDELPTGV